MQPLANALSYRAERANSELMGSPLSCGDLTHHLASEIALSHLLLDSHIPGLKLLKALHFVADHLTEAFALSINRCFAHAVALGRLGHRVAIRCARYPHDLFVAVPALLHANSSSGVRIRYL